MASLSLPFLSLILAAVMWGLYWYPLRLLHQAGIDGVWLILTSYLSALLAAAWFCLRAGGLPKRHLLALTLLALFSGWCNTSFVIAMIEGSVIRVTLLFFLSPVWAVLLGVLFLRERLSMILVLTLSLAMTGAMIMLWRPEIGKPWPLSYADWLGLTSGIAFAAANVTIRYLQDVPVRIKLTSAWIGCILVSLVWILLSQSSLPQAEWSAWLGCVLLGVFGIIIMTLATQFGVTNMPVTRSSIILLFEIVIAAVSSYFLAGEKVTIAELTGGILIAISTVISARDGRAKT